MSDDMMPPPDVMERFAKNCRCCRTCGDVPCAGVMAGGLCDDARCSCDDEREEDDRDDFDYNACPGCGGNCWTACR